MFEFKARFGGRLVSSFKDKKTAEMVPYYNLSFFPFGEGLPVSCKATKEAFDAYEKVKPLEPVSPKFNVNKDGIMRIIV
jgi:hypothetical protein